MTKTTTMKKSAIDNLPALEDKAAKVKFAALQKAGDAFLKELSGSDGVPYRYLRVLRRDINVRYVASLKSRKAEAIQEKRESMIARIAKINERLAKLEE